MQCLTHFLCLAAVILALSGKEASAQQRVLAATEYSRLLDVVFSPDNYLSQDVQAAIALRYAPSTSLESQLVFVKTATAVRLVEMRPHDGSVFAQANRLLSVDPQAALDITSLAKRIAVTTSIRELSTPEFDRLYDQMLTNISNSLPLLKGEFLFRERTNQVKVPTDGTTYTLLFVQGLQKVKVSIYDTEFGKSQQRIPLTEWMSSVQKRTAK